MSAFGETVTPPAAFAALASPDVSLGFEPDRWILRNTGATAVDYSFDGINVHGTLPAPAAGTNPTEHVVPVKYKKLWVRDGAGSGSLDVAAHND